MDASADADLTETLLGSATTASPECSMHIGTSLPEPTQVTSMLMSGLVCVLALLCLQGVGAQG